jgi:hypothetical protein
VTFESSWSLSVVSDNNFVASSFLEMTSNLRGFHLLTIEFVLSRFASSLSLDLHLLSVFPEIVLSLVSRIESYCNSNS